MKNIFKEDAGPIPVRVKVMITAGFVLLMAVSVAVGAAAAPEEKDMPVLLADGSVITAPWYIVIDGERAALVKSEEDAEKTLSNVIDGYRNSDNVVIDIEVKEKMTAEKMNIENGDDPPEILTVKEAEKILTEGKDGEGYITVITTEEETKRETIEYSHEYKPDPNMYIGEQRVETEGSPGTKEVTKKVVRENGTRIEEEILDEAVICEPTEEVVLTGTKNQYGYGGGDGTYGDDNVSYDSDATYDTLTTPVDEICISSYFGQRWGRLHRGIDLALAQGEPIYAADDGTVYYSGYCGSYGNLVKIDHGNGMQTYYAHCSSLLVSQGQQVKRGERIALVGSTGNSTGPHLHFEVIINGNCVDPADFLEF